MEFSTLLPDMVALRNWIVQLDCHHVAMESTVIYWQPIYEVLEGAFSGNITLLVVNARHMKNVPGKKTDMRDSEWIATLLRAGLLNGSFIPDRNIREFRHMNRYRKSVIRDITSQKNRVEKFLQSSGFRLSAFISDIFGASGRNIISHLIEYGQIDASALDYCLKTKTRSHLLEILVSVNGTLSDHKKSFLKMLMNHYDSLKFHLSEIEIAIAVEMEPFALQVLIII
jgi:transposase